MGIKPESAKDKNHLTGILLGITSFILYLIPFLIENIDFIERMYDEFPASWNVIPLIVIGAFVLSLAYYNYQTGDERAKEAFKKGYQQTCTANELDEKFVEAEA